MAKKKKKSSFKRVLLIILCTLLAIILSLMLAATIFVDSMLSKIERPDASEPTLSDAEIESILNETEPEDVDFTGEVIDPEEIEKVEDAEILIGEDDHIINILLIGQDARPGEGRQRSDSMILCSVNTEKKTLVMTSFLRDTYVTIPSWNGKDYADNRLNVCYVFGGMEMLDECLKNNFGVVVDYNIAVNFSGFEDVIDLMGGVPMYLTSREALYISGASEGNNWLNGEQALSYARLREIDSDFGRTNRQRKVLLSLLDQAKSMSLDKMLKLVEGVIPLVTTDMTNSEITSLAADILPILSELEVTTQYIPAEGTYKSAMVRGMSVLIPDIEANRQLLIDTIGGIDTNS